MTNIYEFKALNKAKDLKEEIEARIENFKLLYEELTASAEAYVRAMDVISSAEDEYNQVLLEYSNEVGIQNIPLDYAEYASNVEYYVDEEQRMYFKFTENTEGASD